MGQSVSIPVLPWFPRDWLSSAARGMLSPLGRAAYLDILFGMWLSDGCRVKDDDRVLRGMSGLNQAEWDAVREDVLSLLPVSDGYRSHPRLTQSWLEAVAYKAKCSAGGKATAAQRWGGDRGATTEQPPSNRNHSTSTLNTQPQPQPAENVPSEHTAPAAPARRKTDPLILALKNRLGSGSRICGDQIRALRGAGWDDARIEAAIAAHAEPGMAPWDWTKKARGAVSPTPRSFADERIDRLLDGMPSLTNGRVHHD